MPVFKRKCQRCKKKCSHREIWYYSFCIRGIRYRQAIPEAQNKYQAEQAESKAKNEVYEGKYGKEPSSITLREFIEKVFLPWAKNEKRSWRNDVSRSKPIIAFFRNKKMREIMRFNVEQFRKERRESFNGRGAQRAPASVDRELQLLSRIFSLAVERGLIPANPCKGVKLSGMGRIVTRYLAPEEEDSLLAVLASPRRELLRNVLLIGLHTGLRRTEILTLHTSQIDLARNIIELQAHQTKDKKFRAVLISQTLRPLLVELCGIVSESGYLFENPKTGKPITDIKNGWASALREAGIEPIRFHDIRHTFGTRAVDGGAPLSAVKEVMGHADIRTTMRYVHATDEGKRKAVEAAAKVRVSAPASLLPHKKIATG